MKSLQNILGWLITLAMPVILALGAVRLILLPWYVPVEYSMPGFPADPYGFTRAERIQHAQVAREYLVNDAGISFLADLRFPEGQQAPAESCLHTPDYDGDCSRLYNNRELKHMLDVKIVIGQVLWVFYGLLGLVTVLGIWAWRGGWSSTFRLAVGRGGWLTVVLILSIIAVVVLAFYPFFVFFHNVFFESGTWMFLWSDTLIRLFPARFWQDTFIWVGGMAGLAGLALGQSLLPFHKKRAGV